MGTDLQGPKDFDKWDAPFGGIRIIKEDEDGGQPGRFKAFGKMLIFATTKRFRWDEDDEVRPRRMAVAPRARPPLSICPSLDRATTIAHAPPYDDSPTATAPRLTTTASARRAGAPLVSVEGGGRRVDGRGLRALPARPVCAVG